MLLVWAFFLPFNSAPTIAIIQLQEFLLVSSETMKRRAATVSGMVITFIVGAAFFKHSLELAATRAYASEECTMVSGARLLATGQMANFEIPASFYQLPLFWLAREATQSVDLFASARIMAFLLVWLNLLLLAMATGVPLRSWKWLSAFLGAATLSLLWEFGFEIRPANLLLTGLLLTWTVLRSGRAGIGGCVFAGAVAVVMQFTVATAWIYILPLTLGGLLLSPPKGRTARWKIALAWVAGALGMLLVFRVSLAGLGLWSACWTGLGEGVPSDAAPLGTILARLLAGSPLLVAVSLAALLSVCLDWLRRGKTVLAWTEVLPEVGMVLIACAVVLLPPSDQPGSLVILAAFAFLLAFRYGSRVVRQLWSVPVFRPVLVTLLIFTHLIPFLLVVKRCGNRLNFRQTNLMELTEELTDPKADWVLDPIGLVPTRANLEYRSQLPRAREADISSTGMRVGDQLSTRPASAIIPNHQMDWPTEADHEFIREHYVALGDDFWVLGHTLPKGGGVFEVVHPGRYRISYRKQSNLLGTYPESLAEMMRKPDPKQEETPFVGTLDGAAVSDRPVQLTVGTHRVQSVGEDEIAVVWVGPRLEKLPQVGRGDHRRLFVNWY